MIEVRTQFRRMNQPDRHRMKEGIFKSDVFVLFCTKGVLDRPFVQFGKPPCFVDPLL